MRSNSTILVVGLVAIVGGLPIYWWALPSVLPIETANGSYENRCCGLITLRNGEMKHGHETVGYTVEYDKVGAYVLPKALVSVASDRLDIDKSANPIKLRLNGRSPTSLEIMDASDAPSHTFDRVNDR